MIERFIRQDKNTGDWPSCR